MANASSPADVVTLPGVASTFGNCQGKFGAAAGVEIEHASRRHLGKEDLVTNMLTRRSDRLNRSIRQAAVIWQNKPFIKIILFL